MSKLKSNHSISLVLHVNCGTIGPQNWVCEACEASRLVLLKFSSVQFSPHFLRTENRTDRFFSELNRTGSNRQTARNFEKCALHKFYTLKLIAASDLCLNFFVLMLFEGTSARKHEIDKELSYLAMTNHSKLRKPCL